MHLHLIWLFQRFVWFHLNVTNKRRKKRKKTENKNELCVFFIGLIKRFAGYFLRSKDFLCVFVFVCEFGFLLGFERLVNDALNGFNCCSSLMCVTVENLPCFTLLQFSSSGYLSYWFMALVLIKRTAAGLLYFQLFRGHGALPPPTVHKWVCVCVFLCVWILSSFNC